MECFVIIVNGFQQLQKKDNGTKLCYLIYGQFWAEVIAQYFQKTDLSPLVWFPFIDDIFFVWACKKHSLNHFISLTQNYSKSKKKSKIKFEIHLFTDKVYSLDRTVSLKHRKLRTTLFTKPTDSHFYLNTSSWYPSHVLKNIPKGKFISLWRYVHKNWATRWTVKSCVKNV